MTLPDDRLDPQLLARLDPTSRMLAEQVVVNAAAVAQATFIEFSDDPASEFAVASHLDATSTWKTITERVAMACAHAVLWGFAGEPISTARISEAHRRIFLTTFPNEAGAIRSRGIEVTYGFVAGTASTPVHRTQRGTGSQQLPRKLDIVCKEFNLAAEREDRRSEAELTELTEIAVRFYVKFLRMSELSKHARNGIRRPSGDHPQSNGGSRTTARHSSLRRSPRASPIRPRSLGRVSRWRSRRPPVRKDPFGGDEVLPVYA